MPPRPTLLDRLPPPALLVAALLAAASFQLLLGTSYVAGSIDPLGHSTGVPVGVVVLDRGARGDEFLDRLQASAGPIAWTRVEAREEAVRLLEAKRLMGALVLPSNFTDALESFASDDPRAALVEAISNPGASTSGNLVAQRAIDVALDALRATVRQRAIDAAAIPTLGMGALTLEQARFVAEPVHVRETAVNAVPSRGANGLGPTYVAMAAWIGGYIGSVALERFRDRLGLGAASRGLLVGGFALAQGGLATLALLAIGFTIPDPVRLWAIVSLGTWMAYAVVTLLLDVLGLAGVVPAFAILALGLPAAGAMYPVEMLPAFFRAIHPYDPLAWLVEALRTSLYARHAGDADLNALRLALLALAATAASVALAWARRARPTARAGGEERAARRRP